MYKKQLTEADIISKFILPAVEKSGWDSMVSDQPTPSKTSSINPLP